jgi:hypothetical protein
MNESHEKTVKEILWEELKKTGKGNTIEMVSLSKKLGCSLSYVSSIARYSFESGFLELDMNANYKVKEIPSYDEFQRRVNEKYTQYRKDSKGKGTPRKVGIPKIPEKFEIKEETILSVISFIIKENKELKGKIEKIIK